MGVILPQSERIRPRLGLERGAAVADHGAEREIEPIDFETVVEICRIDPRRRLEAPCANTAADAVDPVRIVGSFEDSIRDEIAGLLVLIGDRGATEARCDDGDVAEVAKCIDRGPGNDEARGVDGVGSRSE